MHPLVSTHLAILRSKYTPPDHQFRKSLDIVSNHLTWEATAHLPTRRTPVCGAFEHVDCDIACGKAVAVPILRAGLGMLGGFISVIPDALIGHIGIERHDGTWRVYYDRLPDLRNSHVFLLDPMLATGWSAAHAVDIVKAAGGYNISLLSIVAAPQGINCMMREHPDVKLHIAAIDRELDSNMYIRPGLGDAGDRINGT